MFSRAMARATTLVLCAFACVAVTLVARHAGAQPPALGSTPPARAPTALPAAPSAEAPADGAPLASVESVLARDRGASRLWYFGWTGFFVVATSANITLAFAASDPGMRADARVQAVTSALGLISTAALPPPSLFYSPCEDASEACAARQRARLESTADGERLGTSWLAHVGGIAVNIGAGAYSWFHDDRRATAVLGAVVGIAVGELQIWTRPTIARDAVRTAWRLDAAPIARGGAVLATAVF
jgi:hypothetical protein